MEKGLVILTYHRANIEFKGIWIKKAFNLVMQKRDID